MPTTFLSLPGELRNKIYNHVLVRDEPVQLGYNGDKLVPALLATNRTILNEASSMLYGRNCFDFAASNFEVVFKFLNQIGHINASLIRYIRIDFPLLRDLGDKVTFDDDSSNILAKIQSDCINLTTIILSSESTHDIEIKLDSWDSPKITENALARVDARFREISSLQETIAEVYEDDPSDDIRRRMESHGWVLQLVEREPEPDGDIFWHYSEGDCFEEDYLVNDYDEDDYDIDNDSDFWRRAAD